MARMRHLVLVSLSACTLATGTVAAAGESPPRRHAAQAEQGRMVDYHVRAGDNLFTLARLYFVHPRDWRIVQRLNSVADPRRIPVATVLRIPLTILRTEPLTAHVVAARGNVRIAQDGQAIGTAPGTEVPQGAVLETGENGFLTIEWPNGSRTSLPTRSRVRVVHMRRILLTSGIDYDLAVEAGKAETSATPIGNGGGTFRVRTPRAVSAVRGTRFRVGLADANSLTEVLEGTVAAGAEGKPPEPVANGLGAVITPSGSLTKETLLPAPDLLRPGKVQVDPLVRLQFAPLDGAARYRVQIGLDAGFTEILTQDTENSPLFALPDIPNGALFVRATAIAASGLEGLAQTYAMRRVLTGLAATADGDADAMRFKWSGSGSGTRTYHFQMLADRGDARQGATPVIDEPGLVEDGIVLHRLAPGTYRWRVGVRQVGSEGVTENWLPFEKLVVAPPEP